MRAKESSGERKWGALAARGRERRRKQHAVGVPPVLAHAEPDDVLTCKAGCVASPPLTGEVTRTAWLAEAQQDVGAADRRCVRSIHNPFLALNSAASSSARN
eukprot:6198440-Pleurochrysis_carterae.AAC.3